VDESDLVKQDLSKFKEALQQQQSQDDADREKMQGLMARLEANGTTVSKKQQEVDQREQVLKEASGDIESGLNELIKLVRTVYLL
jgi:hypothetical protein